MPNGVQKLTSAIGNKVRYIRNHGLYRSSKHYFGSNFTLILVATVAQVLVARLAGVENMGIYRLALIIEGYSKFLQAGLNEGYGRQLPFALGRNDDLKAEEMTGLMWGWVNIVGLIRLAAYAIYAFTMMGELNSFQIVEACLVLGATSYFVQKNTIYDLIYRSKNEHIRLSRYRFIESIYSIASVSFLLIHPWYGFLVRWLFKDMLPFILLSTGTPMKVKPNLKFGHFKELLKVGLPLFGSAYAGVLMDAVNKSILFAYFGEIGLGVFTVATMVMSSLKVIQQKVIAFFSPRMKLILGKTGDPKTVYKTFIIPTVSLGLGFIPIIAIGYAVLPWFVNLVLPDYHEGILAGRWALIAIFFRTMNVTRMVFSTFNKGIQLLVIKLISFAVMIGAMFYGKNVLGMGVEVGSFGLILEAVVNLVISFPVALYYLRKEKGYVTE